MNKFKKLSKPIFDELLKIFPQQEWLVKKDDEVIELLKLAYTTSNQELILLLLKQFKCLSQSLYNYYIDRLVAEIIEDSVYTKDETLISALTHNSQPDSSQAFVQTTKIAFLNAGWGSVDIVNKFGEAISSKYYHKKQIIFVDDFIGSGSTALNQLHSFRSRKSASDNSDTRKVKFAFLAGMRFGIEAILEKDATVDVHCVLRLERGISDSTDILDKTSAMKSMLSMEKKLASQIGEFQLSKYSLGYRKAEALYSLESENWNSPNSVFPIFWWPRKKSQKKRKTILTRYEKGLD